MQYWFSNLVKFIGSSRAHSDGLEKVVQGFACVAAGAAILITPVLIYTMSNPSLRLYKHVLYVLEFVLPVPIPRIILILIIALLGSCAFCTMWIPIVLGGTMMIVYVNSTCIWMEGMRKQW